MTEKKNPQTEPVDWAERLKASMNSEPQKTPNRPSAPAAEEDDLAALLRAQLAHRDESDAVSAYDLDTSEFETEDMSSAKEEVIEATEEEVIEVAEEEVDEAAEEKVDEAAEEKVDEAAEEEVDEAAEEKPIDSIEVEDSSTLLRDDPGACSNDGEAHADLPLDDPEDYSYDEEASPDLYWDDPENYSYDEEDPTSLPWNEPERTLAEEDENTSSVMPESSPSRRYQIEYIPYEEWDDETLPSPDGAVGDPRLAAAVEESIRLLDQEDPNGEFLPQESLPEDPCAEEPSAGEAEALAESHAVPIPPPRRAKPAEPIAEDPLQLGLDDILPRVETLPPAEPSRDPKKHRDYTARMASDAGDEAVQDTEMYLRLGYEEQMTRSERRDAVEEARRRARERANRAARSEAASVKSRREYTGIEQTPAIERAYTRARRLGVTRLCVAAVGALFGILYDYLGIMSGFLQGLNPADSPLYPIMGLMWTALICLPFLSRLGKGLRSLVDFEPTRYAVSALALTVSAINSILSVFTGNPRLYGGVALLMLTVAAVSEYVTAVAEHRAFSVVSSGKTAFVLTDEPTSATANRPEKENGERILTAVRAGRLSDYFARTGRYNPYMGRLNYLIPVALLAAIVCAGAAILRGGTLSADGVPVFTAVFLSCLPATYLLAMSLPLLRANGILRRKGTAVIGTAAPADYTGKGSARLLIRDGDALWGLNRKEITLRDDPNAAHWRRQAARLFRLLECPLWVESPLNEDAPDGLCVEVAETEEGYVRLFLIDSEKGETDEIMMGFREPLARRGIRLPKASMERVYKRTEESRVIYLAFDRQFRIAYAVEYRVGQTFARAVEKLASLGDTAALMTYDPLVGPGLLKQETFKKLPAVELLRPDYVEPVLDARSGGLIATGRSLDLLYPYAACHRMRRVYRLFHLVSWLAIAASTALSLLTVLAGRADILSSAAVTVWQILLTAFTSVMSLTALSRESLFMPRAPRNAVHGKLKDTPGQASETNDTNTDTDKE